jgi:hypothetical protein
MKTGNRIQLILLFCIQLISFQLTAQISVNVNGKMISPDEEIKYNDELNTIHVGFTNAKKIPEYTTGKVELLVKLVDEKGEYVNGWNIVKNGYSALTDFLYPSTSVSYCLLNETAPKNDFGTVGYDFLSVCKKKVDDVNARTISVNISLTFYEKTTYDTYGSPITLCDDFNFTVDIWKSSTTVSLKPFNMRLNFGNVPQFNNVVSLNTDYIRTDKKQQNAQGFGTGDLIKLNFGKQDAYLRSIKISGKSQSELLEYYKASFENFLNVIANGCNTKEIKSKFAPLDEIQWDYITGFEIQNTGAPTSEQKFQKIYTPLDQLNNPNFNEIKIFENFASGKMEGIRFKGLIESSHCQTRSFMLGAGGKEGERSEPADNYVAGDVILYLLKNPLSPDELLLLVIPSEDVQATTESLNEKVKIYDNFLNNISF